MSSLFDDAPTGAPSISQTFINDPKNRHLKVITLGAGIMGMITAYEIQKHCENVELTIYEKNADIGGTWFENRYPGCACDVPSHSYSFHFAPNVRTPKPGQTGPFSAGRADSQPPARSPTGLGFSPSERISGTTWTGYAESSACGSPWSSTPRSPRLDGKRAAPSGT